MEVSMKIRKENTCRWAWYAAVFAFMYIWFTRVHPLVIFDADDWSYASYIRRAWPIWKDWNPSRVFPEIFMPFVCNLSARLLYPLTGDYLGSITSGTAFVIAVFVTVYVWSFDRLVQRLFQLSAPRAIVISLIFVMFHFLAMRCFQAANQYLFYCWDLTCYYFYLIPSLLNASLVMWMSHHGWEDGFRGGKRPLALGVCLLLVYLAIFSNLPSSGILAAFAGCRTLLAMIRSFRKTTLKNFLQQTGAYLGILLMWLVSAAFELSGGRAGSTSGTMLENGREVLRFLIHPTMYCGKVFLLYGFVILAAMVLILIFAKKRTEWDEKMWSVTVEIAVCGLALLVYSIVLTAKVGSSFIYRSEYLFGLFFYLILLITVSLAYITAKYPSVFTVLPIVICLMASSLNTPWQTYKESNIENIDAATCRRISNDLIEQVITAQQNGAASMELYVPVSDKDGNWPHYEGKHGIAIAHTLFEHGVISREMEVIVIPRAEMNEVYGISHHYG